MNFNDAKGSAELVLLANQVPLLVGETGIGKSSLARTIANQEGWALEIIDGNLLKEGEIGGLPTVQEVTAWQKRDEKCFSLLMKSIAVNIRFNRS